MKAQILKALKSQKAIVPAEMLSASLGISSDSVQKHICQLREFGYEIDTTRGGYRLLRSPDVPFPWEFPERESKILYYAEVSSTMTIAKALARKNCPDFTVVVAGRQKKGRGRLNRIWLSEAGGLYFTIVLRPQIPVFLSPRVNFLTSLTLARVLRDMYHINAGVKWPNDILVEGCKVVGMLSEMEAEADQVTFINIGLGINVNNDPSFAEPKASSLKRILGKEVSRKHLLSRFLDVFEDRMRNADFDQVIPQWKKLTVTLNRNVTVVTHQEVTEGFAVDVDPDGALILKLADGSHKKVLYGDCFQQES